MATDETLRLCEALSLSEEDGPVLDIAGDVQADGIRSVEHCLVGKIVSRMKMVWARGPWHFDKNLIILEKPVGLGAISQLRFKFSEFWIHIYKIPLVCINCKVARLIAEKVGTIVDFSMNSKDLWGKFLRIKVRIDITKPLKKGYTDEVGEF
ncbi:hypothetical protein ACOSQ4_005340 [Xanthoceras sorbifolium]